MYLPMQIEPIAFKLQSLPTTSVSYKNINCLQWEAHFTLQASNAPVEARRYQPRDYFKIV